MQTRTRNILTTACLAALASVGLAAEPKFVVVGYQDGTQQVIPETGKQLTDEQKKTIAVLFPAHTGTPTPVPVVTPTILPPTTGVGGLSFPLDKAGWIVWPKANESVDVCVDTAIGNDSGNGSVSQPVRTLKRALALLPSGKQWTLWLRAGQSFGPLPVLPSGTLAQYPNVVRAWGSGRANVGPYVLKEKSNIALVDLQFKGKNTGKGSDDTGLTVWRCNNVFIEGCEITGFRDGLVAQSDHKQNNLIIRRNVIHDQNATPDNQLHSQGTYLQNWDGVLIEDNYYNCNGWRPNPNDLNKPLVQKTVFNHNLYMHADNWNVRTHNNLTANAAATGWQDRCSGSDSYLVSIDNPVGANWGIVHGSGPGHAGGCTGSITDSIFQGGGNIGKEPRGLALVIGNVARLDASSVYFVKPFVTVNTTALQFEKANKKDAAIKQDVGCNVVNLNKVYAVDFPRNMQVATPVKTLTMTNCWLPGVNQSAGQPTKVVTVDDYAKSIGLKDAQDLVEQSMGQSRANWRTELEPKAIMAWIENNWNKGGQ